ncbi:MAG: heavy metal translocating P-type ATPase metal-binding domain-containing protein [Saprospiraceae bacterium]
MIPAPVATICFHCGADCEDDFIKADDKVFCCEGCSSVYQILHRSSLDQYYCQTEKPGNKIALSSTRFFPILDDKREAAKFISYEDESILKVSFFLPEIHCASCIWLLEHLYKINPGINHSAVNFTEKKIYLALDPALIQVRGAAELLASLGYEPQIETGASEPGSSKSKRFLVYTGIAGFAFANIMLLSFPEYLGLKPESNFLLSNYFRYINLILSLPVIFIAYKIFFLNAFKSLRRGIINIDAPVSLAIIVTFLRSVYEILSKTGSGFLDSMSGIVFFMLIGRYLQQKTFASLRFNRKLKSFFPITVEVVKDKNKTISTNIHEVEAGWTLYVRRGEILPVDGEILDGNSQIDYSFITGESRPIDLYPGKQVFAGGRLLSNAVSLKVLKSFSTSDFTQLWNNEVFQKEQSNQWTWTDRVGTYFSILVLIVAVISMAYWFPTNSDLAWNALTSVLIIACPCALLLSSSYTSGFITQLFARNGFFVKNAEIIDQLTKIDHVVFDKTGTLTAPGEYLVTLIYQDWIVEERDAALSLIKQSMHPLSQAISKFEKHYSILPVSSWKEIQGQGIEGWAGDRHIKIGNASFTGHIAKRTDQTEVFINMDGNLKAHYVISTEFRQGISDMLSRLPKYKISLLSGDTRSLKSEIIKLVPDRMSCTFEQSPQDKLNYIKALQGKGDHVMMVGDGLNDAGALKQSDLGVAVVDHYHSFAPACDIILSSSRIVHLDHYIKASKKAKVLIWIAFLYALIYNIIGLYYAVGAKLHPMIAAILMPLSSLGVIVIAYIGSNLICKRLDREQGGLI